MGMKGMGLEIGMTVETSLGLWVIIGVRLGMTLRMILGLE